MLAQNQAAFWCLNVSSATIGWVSPIYKQSKKVYNELENAFAKTNLFSTNKADLLLKSKYTGSTIQFFSAENYNNLRGFTFDFLIVDEFAFVQESAWTEVLRATVLVKGQKVLLISTPKGKNHFHKLYLQGFIQGSNYKSFHMTSYDNPLINPQEIEEAKNTLPNHVFKQEYLAEFLDDGSLVFPKPIILNDAQKTERTYCGIDLGRADDYSVITVQNHKGQVIEVQRWKHMEWSAIITNITNIVKKYNADGYVEVNGIGDPLFEQLKKICPKLKPFVTSSKSKNEIIEQLIIDMQDGTVSIPQLDWLILELEVFTFEYSPKTKSVKYAAPYGFHDDGVMSLAICNKARKDLIRTGVYHIY